ncbi:MAG TPA: hypothetical protein DCY13_19485 [Verrucomicrobiales bacterium]|nr:hypothetical protein [Verrucomicrobiales bacterium]
MIQRRILCACVAATPLLSGLHAPAQPLIPQLEGEWWRIASQPDLGVLTGERQEPVDFGVWRATDGTWQLWSCIRGTKESGTGRLFYGWEGMELTAGDWAPRGIQMRANVALDEVEGGLQAPYVKVIDGRHHMFYGTWKAIALALSEDGRFFQRQISRDGAVGLFGEPHAHNARDAMVVRHKDLYYCYYTVHPDRIGRILCRTSPDLKTWSEAHLVRIGGAAGDKLWSHECPHVVELDGAFYLFTTQNYRGSPRTTVYRSANPLNFGLHDDSTIVASLPVAAPELILHEGQWYVAALTPELDGIRVARLSWQPAKKQP